MALLIRQSPDTICYASVLHLLLVEVYEELQALGKSPIIAFGSLLGAVRGESMIPFTEDAGIAYIGDLHANDDLQEALWRKGYHVFFMDIWRVCLVPTHLLAANLYDPSRPITPNYAVPYLDLYEMKQRNDSDWEMEGADHILPDNSVQPPSEVAINGLPSTQCTTRIVFCSRSPQLSIEVKGHAGAEKYTRRIRVSSKQRWRAAYHCTHSTLLLMLGLLLVGLVTCDLVMETHILSTNPTSFLMSGKAVCTPEVLNASSIQYHSDNRYYSTLKDMDTLAPPVFNGKHAMLCDDTRHAQRQYSYCLPISGRKDTPYCTAADRMDLLIRQSPDTICHASVLHLLLVEVYEELQALGKSPIIAFGSLLGAVRGESMIPFTEDADIAYSGKLRSNGELQRALWRKGYHMFFMDIWRVCVAPTHPLASNLYDASLPLTANYEVPYLDLYEMKQRNDSEWEIQEFESVNGRNKLPDDKVTPFSQVTINGQPFDTVHDPKYFLEEAYGADYMAPKAREQ
ncbi:hypothetical protein BBJ28_00016245 [Nothophytophthora sp. Chile5]|nr:hypothetical protein BBJ28_00016245 [Nothophytophthora sp. Chile5]